MTVPSGVRVSSGGESSGGNVSSEDPSSLAGAQSMTTVSPNAPASN